MAPGAFDPILIDVPERIETERLVLRVPRAGDGPAVHAAVNASLDELAPWMPWAVGGQTLEQAESHCRRAQARFILREDLAYFMFERTAAGGEGLYFGATGLHRIDWPARRFEIGYWRRREAAGGGRVTEAVVALSRMAFDVLGARRVEIRMDDDNQPSWRLAERAGFTREALLRLDSLTPAGQPRSTRVYARVRGDEEPAA